jgi:hypothetical protein
VVATCSERTAAITAKALALEPTARYQTADALLADLEAALPGGKRLDDSIVTFAAKKRDAPSAFAATSPSKR